MLCVLKLELKKTFKSNLFIIALFIGIVITSISAYQNIDLYFRTIANNELRTKISDVIFNPMHSMFSPYTNWIGGDYYFPMTALYYLLLPLLAALPFGWSYCVERKSGYVKNVVTRTSKKHYFLAKYIAVFLSGGAVIAIPLLVNFLTVACFIPAYSPDVFYDIYYFMHYHFLSELFYSVPLLYIAYVILLNFVFAGLIATISLAFTFFVKNRFAVVVLPFLMLLGVHYFQSVLINAFECPVFSPIDFLKAYGVGEISGWVIFPAIVSLFFLTFGVTSLKGARDDVF